MNLKINRVSARIGHNIGLVLRYDRGAGQINDSRRR
ncbi:hypothetical protein LMG28138_02104 [Pararobbsia alpina]|uniref:Uncharacterized protein n=1 Tax=Pararobbsia alpina TaxID=621374 RepID=A0A6S7B2M8_9BURK|nr:hypothetical protein LMG28138_02104 [Pararobbsia alpina]